MAKKKIIYLDVLRILASIAVITIHVAAQNWYKFGVDTYEWGSFNIFNGISRWAVPVFCMISGALFLDCDRKVKIKKLYSKNIFRMAISYLCWSVFYFWLNNVFHTQNYEDMGKMEILKTISLGNYHMWYIFLIIGFYAIVPLLRKISATKESTLYFIFISIIITFIIPTIPHLPRLGWVQTAINKAFLNFTLGYLPYFFIGHYIVKYNLTKKFKALIYSFGLLSFIFVPLGTLVLSQSQGKFYSYIYQYDSLPVLFQSLFVFVFVKDLFNNVDFSKKTEKFISSMSKDTFGVYMIHVFSICVIQWYLEFDSVTINPYIGIPVIVTASYVISEVISFVLNRIPIINKYIV